jgi:hypothetical protein
MGFKSLLYWATGGRGVSYTPNPPVDEAGREWGERPSRSDVRWHVSRNIRGFVIGFDTIYSIAADGAVRVLGKREEVLRP